MPRRKAAEIEVAGCRLRVMRPDKRGPTLRVEIEIDEEAVIELAASILKLAR